jgi:hypothetical protein
MPSHGIDPYVIEKEGTDSRPPVCALSCCYWTVTFAANSDVSAVVPLVVVIAVTS